MTTISRQRVLLVGVLAGLAGVSWAALWWLEQSPLGVLFHAHPGVHTGHGAAIDTFSATGAGLFVAGWSLMTIAMMLPATFPVVETFRRLVSRRDNATTLVSLMLGGYLAVWMAFGAVVYLLQLAVDQWRGGLGMPLWAFAAVLFGLAGAFQFSALKYQCLDRCRTPLGFVMTRWQGRAERITAFRIGVDHGAFCVGCCWALMLLMFAVASAHLLWMVVLAIVMGVEKSAPWGRHLGRPLGVLLIGVAITLTLYNTGVRPIAD